jgi:hypothetical protein
MEKIRTTKAGDATGGHEQGQTPVPTAFVLGSEITVDYDPLDLPCQKLAFYWYSLMAKAA